VYSSGLGVGGSLFKGFGVGRRLPELIFKDPYAEYSFRWPDFFRAGNRVLGVQ
jgi:hypothetical protein